MTNVETKKSELTRYLLITQISIYAFIVLHSIAWHVFGFHGLTKLCPFALREQMAGLEFNLNIVFWFLIFCSTLFLGRAFCAWGCMFGAYQDFVARLAKKLKIKPLKSNAGEWLIRVLVTLIITAYVVFNQMYWPTLFWFSAAIILIGLILWILVERRPTKEKLVTFPKYVFLGWYLGGIVAMWIVLNVFQKGVSVVFDKYEILDSSLAIWNFLIFIMILVAVGVLTGTKRMFCRYLCPVGLILRFTSAIPFPAKYRVRSTGEICIKCGKCDKECFMGLNPMEEISKEGVVKNPNCINCLACVSTCPRNVIGFAATRESIQPAR